MPGSRARTLCLPVRAQRTRSPGRPARRPSRPDQVGGLSNGA